MDIPFLVYLLNAILKSTIAILTSSQDSTWEFNQNLMWDLLQDVVALISSAIKERHCINPNICEQCHDFSVLCLIWMLFFVYLEFICTAKLLLLMLKKIYHHIRTNANMKRKSWFLLSERKHHISQLCLDAVHLFFLSLSLFFPEHTLDMCIAIKQEKGVKKLYFVHWASAKPQCERNLLSIFLAT